jgi:predicted amidohydrolase YtcJ
MADVAARKGITTIHAFEGSRMSGDRDFKVLLDTFESLPIRVLPYYESFELSEMENKKIRGLGGCGRCNLDGMPNTYTAALNEPYADAPEHRGELHYSQEKIDAFILDAYARGIQVGMHAMGDAAIEQLLLSHERAQREFPDRKLRHRIEHFHIPTRSQIARASKLGLVLAMHPIFSHLWGGRGDVFHSRFGEERYHRIDRYSDLISAGCVVTTGADLPVHPPEPLLWLGLLIENPVDRTQDISLDEALRIAIWNGAYAGFEENDKGSLELGKLADLIVIDRDPYACAASELRAINVESTLVGGKVVYSRGGEA